MDRRPLLASVLLLQLALPAHATHLDYMETASSRIIPGQAALAEYGLDTGPALAVSHEISLIYGLTDELMGSASMGLAGSGMAIPGYQGYELGFTYAPPVALLGLSPAMQVELEGGTEQAVGGTAILSYNQLVAPVIGQEFERFNLSLNMNVERHLAARPETHVGYALGASYPIVGARPQEHRHEHGAVHRHSHAIAKAGIEAIGTFESGSAHYIIPSLYLFPIDSLRLAVGLGMRAMGDGEAYSIKSNLQYGF